VHAVDQVTPVFSSILSGAKSFVSKIGSILGGVGRMITSPLGMLGIAGAGVGMTALIAGPLKLAGEMEQARVSFKFFLEDEERAKRFIGSCKHLQLLHHLNLKMCRILLPSCYQFINRCMD